MLQCHKRGLLNVISDVYTRRNEHNLPTNAPPHTSTVPQIPAPSFNTGGVPKLHSGVQVLSVPALNPPPAEAIAPSNICANGELAKTGFTPETERRPIVAVIVLVRRRASRGNRTVSRRR